AEREQRAVVLGAERVGGQGRAQAGAQPGRGERRPEAVGRAREVVPLARRVEARIDPDEDEVEPRAQIVGQAREPGHSSTRGGRRGAPAQRCRNFFTLAAIPAGSRPCWAKGPWASPASPSPATPRRLGGVGTPSASSSAPAPPGPPATE